MGFSPCSVLSRVARRARAHALDLHFVAEHRSRCRWGNKRQPDPSPSEREKPSSFDTRVPNPVAEILKLKDTLQLSAVQIVALTDVADTLQATNGRLYRTIQTLLAKSQEAGDKKQMAGSIAMMLEEASTNTARAVAEAEKLLRPEQWAILPVEIRSQPDGGGEASQKQ